MTIWFLWACKRFSRKQTFPQNVQGNILYYFSILCISIHTRTIFDISKSNRHDKNQMPGSWWWWLFALGYVSLMLSHMQRPRKINVLVLIRKKREKWRGRVIFFFKLFWGNWKINVLVLIRNKLKNDEDERKYHIIRKMHAFHVFPKTEYLMRSMAVLFFVCKN